MQVLPSGDRALQPHDGDVQEARAAGHHQGPAECAETRHTHGRTVRLLRCETIKHFQDDVDLIPAITGLF